MLLEYVQSTKEFVLRVDRQDGVDPKELMNRHGLDFSLSASSSREAILYTKNSYAALSFFKQADPAAALELSPLASALEYSWRDYSNRRIKTPPGKELWPFQRAGVEYAMQRKHTLIGDQPGLGKTPQAICLANEVGASRILVICPASIRSQWAHMVREWSTMEGRYVVYPIFKSSDGVHPHAEWTIISYDLLRNPIVQQELMRGHYDLTIVDEAHYCKTPSAGRTRAIFGMGLAESLDKVSDRILALTGTPLPNRPRECYTLARGLCFDAIDGMSEKKFLERFNPSQMIETKKGKRYLREEMGRLPELQNRLRANFMVRRLKRQVLTQLPPIQYEVSYVEKTGAIRKALEAERMLDIDPTNFTSADPDILGHISTVRKEMGIAKAPLVAEYVDMCLRGGEEKLVVFGWHIGVLDILQEALQRHGVVRVDGRTSARRKDMSVKSFQHPDGAKVFLGNIQSAGVGLDGLQEVASHVIFAECSWTPSDNDQAVGRLERIGQRNAILAEFLVAEGSFDEKVLSTSIAKLQNIHAALDREI